MDRDRPLRRLVDHFERRTACAEQSAGGFERLRNQLGRSAARINRFDGLHIRTSVQSQTSRTISQKENDPTWRRERAAAIASYNTVAAVKFLILGRHVVIEGSTRHARGS